MPAISVIMPVYNAGEKVNMAINSVLEQSFQDFELIIIDDGSTDNSLDICQQYANVDMRVKIIHQENRGLSAARNIGIKAASGKYLAFIDHDDFYLQGLLEENFILAENEQADLVKYSYAIIDENKKNEIHVFRDEIQDVQCLKNEELLTNYIYLARLNRLIYVWDALFRADLIEKNQIKFDESFKRGHEDIAFCLEIYPRLARMVINRKKYYIHVKYKASTSKLISKNYLIDTKKIIEYEKNVFASTGLDLQHPEWWSERFFYYIHFCVKYVRKPDSSFTRKDIYSFLMELSHSYYNTSLDANVIINLNIKLMDKFFLKLFALNKINLLSYLLLANKGIKKCRFKQ